MITRPGGEPPEVHHQTFTPGGPRGPPDRVGEEPQPPDRRANVARRAG